MGAITTETARRACGKEKGTMKKRNYSKPRVVGSAVIHPC